MKDIHTLIKSLILFQVIDASMHNNPPDPTFKGTLVLERMYLRKYLDKSFLQHIFCIFSVMGKPVAHSKHFRTVPVIQLLLGSSMILQTSLQDGFFGHKNTVAL
jgi:hypothetical protein